MPVLWLLVLEWQCFCVFLSLLCAIIVPQPVHAIGQVSSVQAGNHFALRLNYRVQEFEELGLVLRAVNNNQALYSVDKILQSICGGCVQARKLVQVPQCPWPCRAYAWRGSHGCTAVSMHAREKPRCWVRLGSSARLQRQEGGGSAAVHVCSLII